MPLGADQGLGALVWSPLGWGRLTGKIRRGAPLPEGSRLHDTASFGPPVADELLFRVVDALEAVAEETGRSVPQVALNWLTRRPTVASVIIGAATRRSSARTSAPSAGRSATHRSPGSRRRAPSARPIRTFHTGGRRASPASIRRWCDGWSRWRGSPPLRADPAVAQPDDAV
jgi:Predicted oxidoreductases (related to aryl-alcohol dehydrogenases)